jgi:2-C-methyl-D-erythritol 4-phosphate cytidylyltransferase
MDVGAIIVAGGSGSRLGGRTPKQFLSLGGEPILVRTLRPFEASPVVDVIIPVVPPGAESRVAGMIEKAFPGTKCLPPATGGERRRDSVKNGFERLPPVRVVVIHDGARPFVTIDLIERTVAAAWLHGAALTAVRPTDTVKLSDDGALVTRTIDRRRVWLAQTPQAFRTDILERAWNAAGADDFTDEASLVEAAGYPVALVEGHPANLKITGPHDLVLARAIASRATALFGEGAG